MSTEPQSANSTPSSSGLPLWTAEDLQIQISEESFSKKFKALVVESFHDSRLSALETRVKELEEMLSEKEAEASTLRTSNIELQQQVAKLNEKLTFFLDEQEQNPPTLGPSLSMIAAEWQFETGKDEWSSLPADCSKALHDKFEEFVKGSPSTCRMKSGVEEYNFDFESMKQENIRTRNTRAIRCSFNTPAYWTRCTDLKHIYQLTQQPAIAISGCSNSRANGIYVRSTHEQLHGHFLWWKVCGSSVAYVPNGKYLAVFPIMGMSTNDGQKQDGLAGLRSGKLYAVALLPNSTDFLKVSGVWRESRPDSDKFIEAPSIQVSRCSSAGLLPFMNIAVEVEDANLITLFKQTFECSANHHGSTDDAGFSACDKFREHVEIARVYRVENWPLWNKYRTHIRHMKLDIQKYNIKVDKIDPPFHKTLDGLAGCYGAELDGSVNECLLLHGTSFETASKIALEGFDFRLSKAGYYGQGTYFASQACKSDQYTPDGLRTMIISRVAVGDLTYAVKVNSDCRRPPLRAGTARCYDTFVARPGPMPGHSKGVQAHQEFIIFEKFQAYPEFIVQYFMRDEI